MTSEVTMDLLRHVRTIIFAVVWVFFLDLLKIPAYSFWWFASMLIAWHIFEWVERFRDRFMMEEKDIDD